MRGVANCLSKTIVQPIVHSLWRRPPDLLYAVACHSRMLLSTAEKQKAGNRMVVDWSEEKERL